MARGKYIVHISEAFYCKWFPYKENVFVFHYPSFLLLVPFSLGGHLTIHKLAFLDD